MSLPAVDPANLPAIPLWVRQWIYLLFLLVTIAANCVDAFYETDDPWWLPGVLRVLLVLAIVPNILALANARPTAAERTKALRQAEAKDWDANDQAEQHERELQQLREELAGEMAQQRRTPLERFEEDEQGPPVGAIG